MSFVLREVLSKPCKTMCVFHVVTCSRSRVRRCQESTKVTAVQIKAWN